ncbi:MAG: DUF2723 domain-containing protein [Chloroflexota bacterium]
MGWRSFQRALPPNTSSLPGAALLRRISPSAPWLVTALSLALFVGTLSQDITWRNSSGDGGELITASMTLGIAHPPGYPLYIIIGRLFGLLPFGTVAARYAFLSALAGAAAIGLAVRCMLIDRPNDGRKTSLAAPLGLALAVTPLVWGQAIVAEVYALFLFSVALFIWAVLAKRSPLLVGLTFGLAVAAHLTGLILLPLALWKTARSGLGRLTFGALIGLLPFLLLPALAAGSSPLVWGDPDSLGGWWWLVSASLYRPNVFGLPPSMWLARLIDWLNPAILVPLLLWLGLALLVAWRTRHDSDKRPLALTITAILFAIYAFTYRPDDSAVLLLPALMLSAIVAGRGLSDGDHLLAWLLPLLMVILALVASPWQGDDRLRVNGLASLAQLPPDAIVITPGDATVSTLWYLHHVEGVRPDIIIVDQNMFQFDWYRERTRRDHSPLWMPMADDLAQFVNQNLVVRPVCQLSLLDAPGSIDCLSAAEASLD